MVTGDKEQVVQHFHTLTMILMVYVDIYFYRIKFEIEVCGILSTITWRIGDYNERYYTNNYTRTIWY